MGREDYVYDPHEQYNPNLPQRDWEEYQRDPRTLEIASKVKNIISSGMLATVKHSILSEITFDVKSRIDYPAVILQMSYSPHWSALAIAMMTHGCFVNVESEEVIKFTESKSPNPIKYHPNIEFMEDEYGRRQPVWKGTAKAEKLKQLDLFEF